MGPQLVGVAALAGCAPAPRPPSAAPSSTPTPTFSASSPATASQSLATLIVRQTFSGNGFYTEGAYAYVELFEPTGRLLQSWDTMDYNAEQELVRFMVDAGRYEVRSYVRRCEAACPVLDAPIAACSAMVDVAAGGTVTIRIERDLRSCEATRA